MPLPWKKNRVTRISQIVADLQSPKHGGSLVVETGFPTSLIDLFVKNKGRFRRRKNKKGAQVGISDPVTEASAAPAPPPSPSATPETWSLSDRTVCTEGPILDRRVGVDVHGDHGVTIAGQNCDLGRESDGGSNLNTVLAAVLKIFVVVVFTLCMDNLTAGITISAFVLLFLEFIGKRVFRCLKPYSDTNRNFRSLAQRVLNPVMGFKQRQGSDSLEASISPTVDEENLVLGAELDYSPTCIPEIEIVESKSEKEKRIPIPHEETLCAELDSRPLEHSELRIMEKECDECKGKDKDKRSSKLKSKIFKKLVPKNLRRSKRELESKRREGESSFSSSEISCTTEESDKSRRSEIEEEQNYIQNEEPENGNRSLLLLPRKLESIEDNEVGHGVACSNEFPLQEGEDREAVSKAKKRVDRVQNSGYRVLLLIALAGLVVGRFSAMLLTMAWIFLLKMVKTGGISVNMHLLRCSIPISWKKNNG